MEVKNEKNNINKGRIQEKGGINVRIPNITPSPIKPNKPLKD